MVDERRTFDWERVCVSVYVPSGELCEQVDLLAALRPLALIQAKSEFTWPNFGCRGRRQRADQGPLLQPCSTPFFPPAHNGSKRATLLLLPVLSWPACELSAGQGGWERRRSSLARTFTDWTGISPGRCGFPAGPDGSRDGSNVVAVVVGAAGAQVAEERNPLICSAFSPSSLR